MNDAGTVWILSQGSSVLITACYVDDVLHFINDHKLDNTFRQSFEKTFYIMSSDTVDVYLRNRVVIDKSKRKVALSQTHYILSCLDRFGLSNCSSVDLPLRARLSSSLQPSTSFQETCSVYRAMVGTLLYIAQWTRPDISYSFSSFLVLSPIQEMCIWNRPSGFFVTFVRHHRCIWNTPCLLFQDLLSRIISCGDVSILIGLAVQTLGNLLLAMF